MSTESKNLTKQSVATILMLAGGLFLFCSLAGVLISTFWPFLFIIMPGLVFLSLGFNNTPTRHMVIPGAIIVGTGLILQVMSIVGHWEAWAYAWTLYAVFLGMAFIFVGENENGEESLASVGNCFVRFGLSAFLFLGLVFETLIFQSFGSVGTWFVALLLFGVGYWMMRDDVDMGMFDFRNFGSKPKRKNKDATPDQAGIYKA